MNSLLPVLFIVVIFAAFYFMVVRPARQRQLAAQRVQAALTPGQEVMTTAGIFGIITEVHDDRVALQVAPGVELSYARAAIAEVISEPLGTAQDAPAVSGDAEDESPESAEGSR